MPSSRLVIAGTLVASAFARNDQFVPSHVLSRGEMFSCDDYNALRNDLTEIDLLNSCMTNDPVTVPGGKNIYNLNCGYNDGTPCELRYANVSTTREGTILDLVITIAPDSPDQPTLYRPPTGPTGWQTLNNNQLAALYTMGVFDTSNAYNGHGGKCEGNPMNLGNIRWSPQGKPRWHDAHPDDATMQSYPNGNWITSPARDPVNRNWEIHLLFHLFEHDTHNPVTVANTYVAFLDGELGVNPETLFIVDPSAVFASDNTVLEFAEGPNHDGYNTIRVQPQGADSGGSAAYRDIADNNGHVSNPASATSMTRAAQAISAGAFFSNVSQFEVFYNIGGNSPSRQIFFAGVTNLFDDCRKPPSPPPPSFPPFVPLAPAPPMTELWPCPRESAEMSSEWSPAFPASKVMDATFSGGVPVTGLDTIMVTQAGESRPWVSVKLTGTMDINYVAVFNRNDQFASMLGCFSVYIGDSYGDMRYQCGTGSPDFGRPCYDTMRDQHDMIDCSGTSGEYVTVVQVSTSTRANHLSIAELVPYCDIPPPFPPSPPPMPNPPPPCLGWCNMWTCGFGACDGCGADVCNPPVCAFWCNTMTAGLSSCSAC